MISDEELKKLEALKEKASNWDCGPSCMRECWVWVKHDSLGLLERLRSAEGALNILRRYHGGDGSVTREMATDALTYHLAKTKEPRG
jgi:hypothetical protein